MSKTDNTRPRLLQEGDPTIKGLPLHDLPHKSRKRRGEVHMCGGSCGYHADINLQQYKYSQEYDSCSRSVVFYGGIRSYGGHAKYERKYRRRQIRQRERHALERVRKSSYQDDFDLLPVREDRRTIDWDLS